MDSLTLNRLLCSAGTAALSDIADRLGLEPAVLSVDLAPVGEREVFAGPAYTVTGESAAYSGSDRLKLASIDGMREGVVAVWAGRDAGAVCCFGDLLATAMRARGVAAAVVDGGVRDISFLRRCGMPVVSRFRTPAQGVGRWRVTACEMPVRVRGALRPWITVTPGDMIVGDPDGVLAIPAARVAEVAAAAAGLSQTESLARADIEKGMPLLLALAKYGQL